MITIVICMRQDGFLKDGLPVSFINTRKREREREEGVLGTGWYSMPALENRNMSNFLMVNNRIFWSKCIYQRKRKTRFKNFVSAITDRIANDAFQLRNKLNLETG